jgi:esterase/lipase superfamily enzyme
MVPVTVTLGKDESGPDSYGATDVEHAASGLSHDFSDAAAWERAVLSTLDCDTRDVVVFIHGYDNTFDQTAEVAANLGATLKLPGVMAFFSWPSRGRQDPLNYLWDLTAVENSEEEIAGFLARLGRIAGPGRVHIIAHSLGAYGLLRALQSATARAEILEPKMHFGQIIFAAPDMDERLFRRLVGIIPKLAQRITLYVADQDMAVFASEFIHGDQRIGLLPSVPPVPILDGIDTIEVLGRRSRVELGHSYFRDAPDVFRDIQTLIHYGEAPALRELRNGFPIPDAPSRGAAWVIRNKP